MAHHTTPSHRPDSGAARRSAAPGGTEPMRQAGPALAGVVTQTGDAAAEGARQVAAATAETVRSMAAHQAEAAQRGGATAAETLERTAEAGREGVTLAAEGGRRLAEAVRESAGPMTRALPGAGEAAALREVPLALGGLMNDMVRTQLRIGQELFRLADPTPLLEAQHQLLCSYLDVLTAGQQAWLQAARQMAPPGLRQG
ncbi:hypothetical protein [Roseicella sp. DB1501]|uniref:hypothetical protein n=1 Tax=Roseicella sp. DB1501 TaxID=2730925 RepID=UPI0014926913|nr:hypothetical protein [Roseicella sp. DB1501]NOG72815.1 hypothetical protein [Roseicella sp. DB1501]